MKIIVEAIVLGARGTGVARYLSNMLDCWSRKYNNNGYYLLMNTNNSSFDNVSQSVCRIAIPILQKRNIIWQQLAVPRIANQMRDAIYFGPNYTLPLALRIPSVLVIHDLSFFRFCQHRYFKNVLLKVLVRLSIKKANICFVDSEFIHQEALALFKEAIRNKVHVLHDAYQTDLLQKPSEDEIFLVKQKYQITAPYLLSVGLIFNRRLPEVLVKSFKEAREKYSPDLVLVLIGENRTLPYIDVSETIEKLKLKGKVIWLPRVSEEELKALYYGCGAFVYLSEYEGFGIPILEAMACEKNVVCSDIAVFKELFEDACYFARNNDVADIASKFHEALTQGVPKELLNKISHKFSWEHTATHAMQILDELHHSTIVS
jgi:glycosyltransferase involved in cell wall biosynthesis